MELKLKTVYTGQAKVINNQVYVINNNIKSLIADVLVEAGSFALSPWYKAVGIKLKVGVGW